MNLTTRVLSARQDHVSLSVHVDLHYGEKDCRDEPGQSCLGGGGAYAGLESPAKYANEGKDHDDSQGERSCRVCPPPEGGKRVGVQPGRRTRIGVIGVVVVVRSIVVVVVRHDPPHPKNGHNHTQAGTTSSNLQETPPKSSSPPHKMLRKNDGVEMETDTHGEGKG